MYLLSRLLKKISFHSFVFASKPLEFLAPRIYMNLFTYILKISGLKITGKPRYISGKVRFDDFSQTAIGDRVVISENVVLLTHDYSITTAMIANNKPPATDAAHIAPITIKENVFIGLGSIILPGTTIQKNTIIAAGSICSGNLEEDSVYAGNPSKRIGSINDFYLKWKDSGKLDSARMDLS